VDARRLYLRRACSSMHIYCTRELHLSDDAAYKRIQVARLARRLPILFTALADGRLHLCAALLLAQYLTPENAGELIEAAAHKGKRELQELIARCFPRPDMPTRIEPLGGFAVATVSAEQCSSTTESSTQVAEIIALVPEPVEL